MKTKVVVKRNYAEVMEIDRKDEDFLKALILYILDSLGDDEDLRLSTRLVKEESNANLEVVNSD